MTLTATARVTSLKPADVRMKQLVTTMQQLQTMTVRVLCLTSVVCVAATALLKATATVMEMYWTNVEYVVATALLRATATVMETGQLLVTTVMVRA